MCDGRTRDLLAGMPVGVISTAIRSRASDRDGGDEMELHLLGTEVAAEGGLAQVVQAMPAELTGPALAVMLMAPAAP